MSGICQELHQLFHQLKRHYFPFDKTELPKNGIYVLFEKGEHAHGGDRIVRIGTHTGVNQLPSRLLQHFIAENKNRSIFRKNIGRALLNKNNDDYIKIWEFDTTSRKNKDKYGHFVNQEYERIIEKEVSRTIQNHFSFYVIEENDKNNRLLYEARMISEISNCIECKASREWLGNYSIKSKIRESSLWQEMQLYKDGFTDEEFNHFRRKFSTISRGL
jgi:hypothetical protein